jgi:hypothetical protein
VFPLVFAVPEFDAFNDAPFAGQVDGAGSATGGDTIADHEFLVAAVTEVDYHAIELNRAIAYSQLNRAEPPVVPAHLDIVA